MAENKPFCISKHVVLWAWSKVRDNHGAAGVDGVSIQAFERKLKDNLYKVWNRMSSGTYFPPPVRRVMIPKPDGRQRPLGIPTVGDRVAQMVVKLELEPKVEPLFHPDSYGYRPGKSALEAVGTCRTRCWRYDWVVDLDISGFFDNIDHSLMMHAVRKHADCPWVLLYIERWLKAPAEAEDGTSIARDRGTPQGGVITPPTIVQNAPVGASVKRADVHPVHHFHLLRLDLHAPHQRPDHFPARLPVSVVQTGRELPRERFKIVNHEAQLLGLRLPVEVRL
jgi:RNA-directed DNA polymerase